MYTLPHRGKDLFDAVPVDIGLPKATVQSYMIQLLDAVRYLHERGIAHREYVFATQSN